MIAHTLAFTRRRNPTLDTCPANIFKIEICVVAFCKLAIFFKKDMLVVLLCFSALG